MIRVRGVPISDEDARELAERMGGDESVANLVDRLERALGNDVGGLIATNKLEARAVLQAVRSMLAEREPTERLLELRRSLVQMFEG